MAVKKRKKGFARKDIKKPDEFVSLVTRFLDFYDEHKREFWIGVGAVVVAALVIWGMLYTHRKRYEKYHYLITKEIDKYNQWVSRKERSIDELKKITEKFQELTDGAPGKLKIITMFYTALGLYQQGKYEPASVILYQLKDKPNDKAFNALIYFNLYKTYAAMHNYKKAMQVINEAIDNLIINPYDDLMRRDLERYKKFVQWQKSVEKLFKKQNQKFPSSVTGGRK